MRHRLKGRFPEGNVPWNKGMIGYRPKGQEIGWFKNGHKGTRTVPVGTVTVRKDRNGTPRRWIKVADGPVNAFNWKPYAVWIWEQANGPVPKGYMVHHADGDSLNDSISNYSLLTRAQHINAHRAELLAARTKTSHHPGKGYVRSKL